jgi:hypothetical protein
MRIPQQARRLRFWMARILDGARRDGSRPGIMNWLHIGGCVIGSTGNRQRDDRYPPHIAPSTPGR